MTLIHSHQRQLALLTEYLREIEYPNLFRPGSNLLTPNQLAINLCREFYVFLGPRTGVDWSAAYAAELTYLLGKLGGESAYCARLTLRDPAVVHALHQTL